MAATSVSIFCPCPCSPSPRFQSSPPLPRLSVCCYSHHLSLSPIDKTFTQIHNSGVIACLRANSAELALKAARAALTGGISVLEIVMSTPGVFEVLQQLVREYPTTTLGVGTVLNVEDAKNAINAGAKFLMSPAMVKETSVIPLLLFTLNVRTGCQDIMVDAQCGEVLYIPGVMTPTEILFAYDSGAKIVKVYPVSALGGSQYISALKRPFHHISMVAAQGITIVLQRDVFFKQCIDSLIGYYEQNQADYLRISTLKS
uniref:KHG/KDPG aldolase n=1 Tax=Fagus sylvatica TaxID=28930 RepID=A0A2N9IFL2_FAGSY